MAHQLLKEALKARTNAISPLSGFSVGCALEIDDGTIVYGANVESGIPVLSSCAERSAIISALSQGFRKFKRIAVIADYPRPTPPCGACRQFILEFAPDAEIITGNLKGDVKHYENITELMPNAYHFIK